MIACIGCKYRRGGLRLMERYVAISGGVERSLNSVRNKSNRPNSVCSATHTVQLR